MTSTGAGGPVTDSAELDAVLAETVRRTGASIGALYLLAPEEQLLHLDVLCGAGAELAAPWTTVPLASPAPVADAVREDRPVWVGSQGEMVRSYPRTAMVLPYPMALAAAPVEGTQRWGALLLMWPATRPQHMTARERTNIVSSCRRVARALEEAAERGRPPVAPGGGTRVVPAGTGRPSASPEAAVADFVERLPGGSCALDLEGRFTYPSAGACELLGVEAGRLLGTLPWQSLRWMDDPAYEDRYRAAVISRAPVAFTACRPPDQWLEFHLYPDASGISVRIVSTGEEPPPARVHRSPGAAAPARAGQLYQLTHLAAALTEVVGVQDVIDVVADQIVPAFGAQGLVLSAAEGGRLRITGHSGYSAESVERLDGLPLDTRLTPAGRALSTGIPEFFADREEMRRTYPGALEVSGAHAWAFLPLIISGRPVGCCVLSYDHPHDFQAEERAVMTSLAGLIAQALDRARLYDTKHELARGLQEALLPHTLPEVDGLAVAARYMPATRGMDIGGDFYDLVRLGDTAAAAVIGDVQGHNAAAAALMGQVRTAVHAHAALGTLPDQVLAKTNRLLADLGPDLFTSCLYARLDFSRRSVTLASAGHPPPLLRLPGGDTRPLVVPPGPLLGIVDDAVFPVTEVALVPGMILALYTDGLVERPGADLDDSIADLARHLAHADDRDLDQLVDELVSDVGTTGQRTDDVAVLLLRDRAAEPGGWTR
ncbi:SpoIIE family protein phosphatase [Streptomyces anandii]|uniref:SpoIIE family protein phosphatase n=1 Tax=Streptomyces anandii TaxID=285454 RepID=UPI0036AFE860